MKRGVLLFLILLILMLPVVEAATISGQVKDDKGEGLPRATIRVEGSNKGVVADNDGKYSLTLDAGSYTIAASYVGYEKQSKSVTLNQNSQQKLDFSLKQTAIQLPEQRVEAERPVQPSQPSLTPAQRIGAGPGLAGGLHSRPQVDYGYLAGLQEKAKAAAFAAAGIAAAKNKAELSKQQGKACSSHGDCNGGVCFGGTCQPKPGDALCVESDAGLTAEKDNPNVKAGIVVNGKTQYDACGCEYPAGQFTIECEKLGKPFTHVRETTCGEEGKVVACGGGCGDGACVKETFMCNAYTTMASNSGKVIDCGKEGKICRSDALGMNKCFVEDNYAVLADIYSSFDAYHSDFVFQPEYEKKLNTFLVSNIEISNLGLQYELLRLLPGYTKLILISNSVGKDVLNSIPPNLKYEVIDVRKNLDIYKKKGIPLRGMPFTLTTDPWAQDLGEGNDKIFYISATRWSWSEDYGLMAPDNDYLFDLKNAGIQVVRLPIMFEGGNINLAKNNKGEKIVFVGEDVVFLTHKVYKKYEFSASYSTTEIKVKEVLKKAFNADKVVIVKDNSGVNQQPALMFHIDQAFVFLDDGLVGLARITDIDDVKAEIQRRPALENLMQELEIRQQNTAFITGGGVKIVPKSGEAPKTSIPGSYKQISEIVGAYLALKDYERLLRDEGFEIVYLDTNAENILMFKAYTNLVVYKDREKNSKEIIMPFFAESSEQDVFWNKNKELLSSRGFNVRGVKDISFLYKGNVHCLSGLLAHVDEPCSVDEEALQVCPLDADFLEDEERASLYSLGDDLITGGAVVNAEEKSILLEQPEISVDALHAYLSQKAQGTKLADKKIAEIIIAQGQKYGIKPEFIAAVALHESGFWTKGKAVSKAALQCNNFFGITKKTKACPVSMKYQDYENEEKAIEDFAKLIKNKYIGQKKADSVEAIAAAGYCGNRGLWIKKIKGFMGEMSGSCLLQQKTAAGKPVGGLGKTGEEQCKPVCKDSTTLLTPTPSGSLQEVKCKQGEVCEYDENGIGRCEDGVYSYCNDRKTLVNLKVKPNNVERDVQNCGEEQVCLDGVCKNKYGRFAPITKSVLRYNYQFLDVDYYNEMAKAFSFEKIDYFTGDPGSQISDRTFAFKVLGAIEKRLGKEYTDFIWSEYGGRSDSIFYGILRNRAGIYGWRIEPILRDYLNLRGLLTIDRSEIYNPFYTNTLEELGQYNPNKKEISNDVIKLVSLLKTVNSNKKEGHIFYGYYDPRKVVIRPAESVGPVISRSIIINPKPGVYISADYKTIYDDKGNEYIYQLSLTYKKGVNDPTGDGGYEIYTELDPISTVDYSKGFINLFTKITNPDRRDPEGIREQTIAIGEGQGVGGREKGEYQRFKYLDPNRYDVDAALKIESFMLKKFLSALEESRR